MKKITLAVLLASISATGWAADINKLTSTTQAQFRLLSEDLTGALSYKAIAPGEPLGITGFDVGIEMTGTKLQSASAWNAATGSSISTLPLPKLHVHKGLPFDIDVGASYTAVPNSNIKLYGAELRYALVSGNVAMPSVAIRGAASKMAGVDQLDFSTKSAELTVSKGFLMLTPYIGAGRVWGKSSPNVANLKEESVAVNKYFIGTNISLGLVNFALEADKTGENNSYSAKFGLRW